MKHRRSIIKAVILVAVLTGAVTAIAGHSQRYGAQRDGDCFRYERRVVHNPVHWRNIPRGTKAFVYRGQNYFFLAGIYYQWLAGMLCVVPQPCGYVAPPSWGYTTTIVAEPTMNMQTVTVWVQNANGSRTPVELRPASYGQWMGPRGEVYATFPSEAALRSIYGLRY
ncbi:MAG: hypothetical protein EOL87_16745 [Spartobacteria bacterium]|nr:hypothetical protein [Spartobacteria bacterium]